MSRVPLVLACVFVFIASSLWADDFGAQVSFGGQGGLWSPADGTNKGYDIMPGGHAWGGTGVSDTGLQSLYSGISGTGESISVQQSGQGTMGTLQGAVTVSSGATGTGNGYATGSGVSNAYFWDYLTVSNPGGGDVVVQFSDLLNATLGSGATGDCNPGSFGSGGNIGNQCAMAQSGFLVNIGGTWHTIAYTSSSNPSSNGGTLSQAFTVANGTTIYFEGHLYTAAASCAQELQATLSPCATGDSTHDEYSPSSAAQFHVDVLTAGASYTTTSGTNYATAISGVPEPATMTLLSVGLLAFGGRRKRR